MKHFSFLGRIAGVFLTIFAITATNSHSSAQSLALDAGSFYPDSAIIHTGLPVKWTGLLSWQSNAGAGYTLNYTFGDASGYTVAKVTGSSANGSDTFRAVHAYAASGTYTAKVVLKNASGVAVDSLLRPFNVGSGYAVAGKFYYDCTQNCQPDTPELGLGKTWIGIKINQNQRSYWTDSLGYYNVGVANGDTLRRNTGVPDPFNTYIPIPFYCANPPVTGTNRAAHVSVWLAEAMYMDNFNAIPYACKGGLFFPSIQTHDPGGGSPHIRYFFGDGTISSYSYSSNGFHSYSYIYSTRGDFTLSIELYGTNFNGPYMRYQRVIHVDSCKKVLLEPFHDAVRNCQVDAGEPAPGIQSIGVRSKFLGMQSVWYNSGRLEYLLYPGDTARVDTSLTVSTLNFTDTVSLRQNCTQGRISWNSPDTLRLPYTSHIRLTGITPPWSDICYADTIRFALSAQLTGEPAGTTFRLISIYGDGHSDSTLFSYSLDTLTLYPKHLYDTSGVNHCTFILQSAGGDVDTLRYTLNVGNCFPVFLQAFYDRNKNCVRDAGEPLAMDYGVRGNSSSIYGSDPATGIAKYFQYAPADSILDVTDRLNSYPPAFYTRAITAAHGCSWPVMRQKGAQYLLALIDTPTFQVSYFASYPAGCDSVYSASLYAGVAANYGHTYSLIYFHGDGLSADTFRLFNGASNGYGIAQRKFLPGNYQPAYRIVDDSTGQLLGRGYFPSFTVRDTCSGKGRLFIDADADCNYSAADIPLPGQPVQLISGSSVTTQLTDHEGRFLTALSGTADSVAAPDSIAQLILACGAAHVAALQPGVETLFPYTCSTGADISLLAAHHYFKDSTADTLLLYPDGNSCSADAGTLTLTLPAGISYTGANLPGAIVSGSTVSWPIDTMRKLPQVIRVGLYVAPAAGASVLCLAASLNGSLPDANPANNDFFLCDSLRTSIPDYYKSASSDSMDANGSLLAGKELIYSLRIRNNTGDTVGSLTLYDTLDTRLDPATLQVVDAGFPHDAVLLPGRVLRIMSDIPFSLAPGAETALRFSIKPQPGTATGAVISNKVSVVLGGIPEGNTNTVYNTAARPSLAVFAASARSRTVEVYPVPAAQGAFYIALSGPTSAGTGGRFELLDVRGALCAAGTLDGTLTRVSTQILAPGVYLVRIVTADGIYLRKMVVTSGR